MSASPVSALLIVPLNEWLTWPAAELGIERKEMQMHRRKHTDGFMHGCNVAEKSEVPLREARELQEINSMLCNGPV